MNLGMKTIGPFLVCESLLMLISFLGASSARAQDPWTQQSALPTDRHLHGAAFITPDHGFAVGINRHLLETTDGGDNWQIRMSDDFGVDPYYAITFADAQHGYITGNSTDAWRTTDAGETWQPMTTLPSGFWNRLDFMSGTTGFAGANGACAFTADAGVTWTLRSRYPDCPIVYGMDFRDTQVGLVGGYLPATQQDGIFKTTDGGVTWIRTYPQSVNDLLWMTPTVAVGIVGTEFYRSTNSGDTWNRIGGGIDTGLLDLDYAGGSLLVGVSPKGDIWRSLDGGVSWTQVYDGLGDLPVTWAVDMLDAQYGWVVGQSGILLETEDGGLTWSLRNSGAGVQIYDLRMHDESFGLAACHNGYVLRTTNGGALWETQKLEVTGQIFGRDESLHGLSIVDPATAVVAGPGGTAFRTDDGGVSWTSIGYPVLPDAFWIEDVEFVTADLGWVVGLDQDLGHDHTVYRTTDGGATWSPNLIAGGYMMSVDFVDSSRGWIGTTGRSIWRTTNGGSSWMAGALPTYFTNPSVSDVEFADTQTGWAAGWDGYLAKTTNGGASWFLQDLGTTQDHLLDLSVVSGAEAWITGREEGTFRGFVYHTMTGGASWTKEILSQYPYIPVAVTGLPSGSAWTGGYNGHILRFGGPLVDVVTPGFNHHSIWLRGTPNPFTTTAAFQYGLPEAGWAQLRVFDVQGREVARLMDGLQEAGSHAMAWRPSESSGSEAPPRGSYFCRLEFVPTRAGVGSVRQVATTRLVHVR